MDLYFCYESKEVERMVIIGCSNQIVNEAIKDIFTAMKYMEVKKYTLIIVILLNFYIDYIGMDLCLRHNWERWFRKIKLGNQV